MIYTFSISTRLRTIDKKIFYGSFLSLMLIIISGWFGGQIAQNINGENMINQHTVSIHLYLAMLIVIIMVRYLSFRDLFKFFGPTKKTGQNTQCACRMIFWHVWRARGSPGKKPTKITAARRLTFLLCPKLK